MDKLEGMLAQRRCAIAMQSCCVCAVMFSGSNNSLRPMPRAVDKNTWLPSTNDTRTRIEADLYLGTRAVANQRPFRSLACILPSKAPTLYLSYKATVISIRCNEC